MDNVEKDYSYDDLKDSGTGSYSDQGFKIITYPFGKYEIKLKLSQAGQFIDIIEIKINKEFLSLKQKIAKRGYHDVSEFYKE